MPVRLSTEKQIREDIKKYTVIAKQLSEVSDIPTWRNNISNRKPLAKGKKRQSSQRSNPASAISRSRQKALETLKDKLRSQKPPFMGRARLSCFESITGDRASRPEPMKGKEDVLPYTGRLLDKARSFEQRVAVDTEYCGLVRIVRDHADEIDFGLLQKLLPKNLEKESQRFHIDNEMEQLLPPKSASFLSGDIDCYFRQVARGFHEFDARDVPLA